MLVKVQELREKVEQGVAKLGYEGDDDDDASNDQLFLVGIEKVLEC